ncbi:MAG: hypothetical protein HUJ26_18815 [Planctomycetaceae bacterium]|nr:hypothetical protein [Planctomycetaceae bacterium]
MFRFLSSLAIVFVSISSLCADEVDFNADVAPIFMKYCNGCHDEVEANGEIVLTSFENVMKGGQSGKVIKPQDADNSYLVRLIEGRTEPLMPPEGITGPSKEEIAVIRRWIAAGALKPTKPLIRRLTDVPTIKPRDEVRRAITAVTHSKDGRWMAVGRYGSVEVYTLPDQKLVQTLDGMTGNVNDVGFSADGEILFAAAGEPGLYGQLGLFSTDTWKPLNLLEGHADSMYAADISPEDKIIATGSYDQTIILWDLKTGELLNTLTGHNGPVYDLEYHPDMPILASASGDRTVKLWDVTTGKRLDTLNEPEKEQYTVSFSPDGKHLAAAGVDRRIRVWKITQQGQEGSNPILYSRFAHEKPIVRVVFSPDGAILASAGEDLVLKLWETVGFTQTGILEQQPDWPAGVSFTPGSDALVVGRMNGTLTSYVMRPEYRKDANTEEPVFLVTAPETIPDVPMPDEGLKPVAEMEPNNRREEAQTLNIPAKVEGILLPAEGFSEDVDLYRFSAKAGQSWVIETNAEQSQSPADTVIDVFHADGEPVLRYLLQAVRESYINFRGLSSSELQVRVKGWEEMGLNQYLYMNGEIGRIVRMPKGPDSGFLLYGDGERRAYFDTTAVTHANEETVYIVEAYPPGTELVDNGLPVFPLYYRNDDDGRRKLGKDSRLMFTAPQDGDYLVRVRDTRGFGGSDYKYSLTIRPPQPGFSISISGRGATVKKGGGVKLTFKADRHDDFEAAIQLSLKNLPEGYSIPETLVIEEGHTSAEAVLTASRDAEPVDADRWNEVEVTAMEVGAEEKQNIDNLGHIKLTDAPKAVLRLLMPDGSTSGLQLKPGGRVQAVLKVDRAEGFNGELKCDVHNLPHGVIVDNLGLNGVMIREGENQRMIFISAEDWVQPMTRPIFASATGSYNEKVKDENTGKEKNERRNIAQHSAPLPLEIVKNPSVVRREP